MTDLEKLLAGIGLSEEQPEQNMSVGEPASFPAIEEAQVDAQNAQTNEMAKSPNLMTKSELAQKEAAQEADRTVAGQLDEQAQAKKVDNPTLEMYQQAIQDYKKKLNTPEKEIGWQDRLPDILAGAHNIVNYAGGSQQANMKLGATDRLKAERAQGKERDLSGLQKLQDMYRNYMKLQKEQEPKTLTELDKKKLALENKKLDLQEKKLANESKKEAPLGFEDKELIKARAKMKVQDEKEQAKIRQANLKEKKAAEQSDKDLDEQLKKITRAKKLMAEMVKQGGVSDTGPIDQYISGFGSKGQELRQSLNDLSLEKMAKLFSGMSKAVDSEAERKMFEQSQASMGNYPDVNMKILNEMEKGIQSLKGKNKNFIQRYDSKGKEISNEKVDVVLPDGRKGRIDADKVESFMKKYPNAQVM